MLGPASPARIQGLFSDKTNQPFGPRADNDGTETKWSLLTSRLRLDFQAFSCPARPHRRLHFPGGHTKSLLFKQARHGFMLDRLGRVT
jgi:hypothetical protein